jgi:hypothetical protein
MLFAKPTVRAVLIRSGSDAGIVGSIIHGSEMIALKRRDHLCWASGDDATSEPRSNTLHLSAEKAGEAVLQGREKKAAASFLTWIGR